jgi:hypothetical protein
VLLFVDATDIRGGLFGSQPRAAMRMLFIAMPLSLAFSVALGLWLIPSLGWAVLLAATAVLALNLGALWGTVVFCLLALTVVRLLPVLVAMLGSVILHGIGAPAAARAYDSSQTKLA